MARTLTTMRMCGLTIAVGVLFGITMTSAAHAAPKPDADQVGAALSGYGNKWLVDNGNYPREAHWMTDTDKGRWEGDAYVCPAYGGYLEDPNNAGGWLSSGEMWVYFDEDGNFKTEFRAGAPNRASRERLKELFPVGGGSTMQGWWQKLHLTLTCQERDYNRLNPLDEQASGTFSIHAPGLLRITYTGIHHGGCNGGLSWHNNGKYNNALMPGDDGSYTISPENPNDGDTVIHQATNRRVGALGDIGAFLTAKFKPASIQEGGMGWQYGGTQDLLVEYCPGSVAPSSAAVALPGTTTQPSPVAYTPPPVAPPQTGGTVAGLLTASGLPYKDEGNDNFAVAFDHGVTVHVHQYEDTLRAYTPLGTLPGDNRANQGLWALEALKLNYTDPLGRLSVHQGDDNDLGLYWECQVPMSVASGAYVKSIARVGASQVPRWQAVARNQEPADIDFLYPGGDDDALLARVKSDLRAAGLNFDDDGDSASVPYDNGVMVFIVVFQGTAWIHAYSGGMPGGTDAERAEAAIQLLQRNWNDPVGRLSLDDDRDVVWECQVPVDYITPAFLKSICGTAAKQVAEVRAKFGDVPFNG